MTEELSLLVDNVEIASQKHSGPNSDTSTF